MTHYLFRHTDSDGDQIHVEKGHSEVLYVDTSADSGAGTQVRLYPEEARPLWSALGEWLGTVEEPEQMQDRHERTGPGEYSTLITAIESLRLCMDLIAVIGDRLPERMVQCGHTSNKGTVCSEPSGHIGRHSHSVNGNRASWPQ